MEMSDTESHLKDKVKTAAIKKIKYHPKEGRHQIVLSYLNLAISLIVGLGIGYSQYRLYKTYQAPLFEAQTELAKSTDKINALSEPLIKTQVELNNTYLELSKTEETLKNATILSQNQNATLAEALTNVAKLDANLKGFESRITQKLDSEIKNIELSVKTAEFLQYIQPAISVDNTPESIRVDKNGNINFHFILKNTGKTRVDLMFSNFIFSKQLITSQFETSNTNHYKIKIITGAENGFLDPGQSVEKSLCISTNEQIVDKTQIFFLLQYKARTPGPFITLGNNLLSKYISTEELDKVYTHYCTRRGAIYFEQ